MFHQRDTWRALAIIAATLGGGASAHAVDEPTLGATVIDGSSAYTPTQLFAAYRDQLGRPLDAASSQAILTQIEALYVRDGYSRPEFRLDQGLAAAGLLRIEVFEPQITRVAFTGDSGPYAARLEELASDLSLRVPLRTTDLQAALQSMRELPGLTVRASTSRDESRRNAYALTVASEYKPVEAMLEISNGGTRALGPMFVFNEVLANSLLGFQERIGSYISTTTGQDEYRAARLFVEAPAGTPDAASAMQLGWSAAFDWDDLDVTYDGARVRSEELRVLELGGRMQGSLGTASRYALGVQVRRGLNEDFLIAKLQFTDLVSFAQRWSVRFDAFGQQSAYALPDVERYKLRGERLGRGFEFTGIAGDQGVGAKAELRREMSSAAALYGFYDFAAAWRQDEPGRESAATAGIGFAAEYWRFSGSIEVAQPLTRADVEGDRDARVFAEVRLKL